MSLTETEQLHMGIDAPDFLKMRLAIEIVPVVRSIQKPFPTACHLLQWTMSMERMGQSHIAG